VDTTTAIVVGALLGGVLTVIGGLLATMWLARREDKREEKRQHQRHVTAVRIVVLELKHNVAALIMRAADGRAEMSSAGISSLAADFYSQVPDDLASDVAWAYTVLIGLPTDEPAQARLWLDKMMGIRAALQGYGERELGLKFALTGESEKRSKEYEASKAPPADTRGGSTAVT
jgi:hypothetical protein